MQRVAALAATSLALLPLACTQPEPEPAPDWSRPATLLEIPDELASAPIVTETSGAWTLRKTARSGDAAGGTVPAGVMLARRARPGARADKYAVDGAEAAAGADFSVEALEGAEAASESARGLDLAGGALPESSGGSSALGTGDLSFGDEKRDAAFRQALPLRAGSSDDNVDFGAFLEFLAAQRGKQSLSELWADVDVSGRQHITLRTQDSLPIPGAEVLIVDEARDVVLWRGTSYGDGRVPFYRSLSPAAPVAGEASGDGESAATPAYVIQVRSGDMVQRFAWDGRGDELILRVPGARPDLETVELDVMFLIDTTGSMGDEIAQIKATLLTVTQKLRSLEREFDLRYGAVLYRDLDDDYVTKSHPFSADIAAFDAALAEVIAQGGGDAPESLNQGLAVAIGAPDWRPGAAKVVFLIADAAPHMDYDGDVPYPTSLRSAIERGIRVHAVAASGLDPAGTVAFRQIAQLARGKFIFIEYGSSAASAETHGVTGKVEANNLADIIYGQIREEVAHWGRH